MTSNAIKRSNSGMDIHDVYNIIENAKESIFLRLI